MDEQDIKNRYEAAKVRRTEESVQFWDRKTRLSYYLISLPIAIFSVAIASYPYAQGTIYLAVLEIIAWVLLLLSGFTGIVAKWGEMEQFRISSIKASAEMDRYSQDYGEITPEHGKASLKREERLLDAERKETRGTTWHWRLLIAGLFVLLLSRSFLACTAR